MRTNLLIVFTVACEMAFCLRTAAAIDIPSSSTDGRPFFRHELIAPPTDRFPSCHCASVVELASGDLLACWYAGEGEAKPDVAVIGARKSRLADQWSETFVLADEPGKPEGNCLLFHTPDGVLWLVYGTMHGRLDGPPGPGVRWTTCDLRSRTSTDEGLTWSDVRILSKDLGYVVRTKPIVMDNGDLIFGCEYLYNQSRFWITADCGKTWKVSASVTGVPNQQPTLVQCQDGRLFSLLRPCFNGLVLRTESLDRGHTWSSAVPTPLPNPCAAVDMVKLHDGRLVLAYNDSFIRRTPLTLALSEDEGNTWPHRRNLIADQGEFSYPGLIQSSDGHLHLVYTHRRTSIGHYELSPEWITADK